MHTYKEVIKVENEKKFNIELGVSEALYLEEAIENLLQDTLINEGRKENLEKILKKIKDGLKETPLLF